jgi:hypothetical protein
MAASWPLRRKLSGGKRLKRPYRGHRCGFGSLLINPPLRSPTKGRQLQERPKSGTPLLEEPSARAVCQAVGCHSALALRSWCGHMRTYSTFQSVILQGNSRPALPSAGAVLHTHVCLAPRPSSLPSCLCLKGPQEVNFPSPPPPLLWKVDAALLITHPSLLAQLQGQRPEALSTQTMMVNKLSIEDIQQPGTLPVTS